MTILDSDLERARQEAAVAGSFSARVIALSRELDLLLDHERDLAERVDLGHGDTEFFQGAGLEELLHTFTEEDAAADDSIQLVSALLQRRVNLQVLADLRDEREKLLARETTLSSALARYTELYSRWMATNSQGDPGRACTLARLEQDEKETELKSLRMEEADSAAGEAEHALECLRVILHDAVDWVPGDTSAQEADTAILRPERVGPADPWLGAAQIALSRARRALEEVGSLESGEFQVDLLSGFAELCIQGLVCDHMENDGTVRALRPVTWTLTTVRALRGYLSRSRGDARRTIEDLRARRAQLLQRGSR